MEYNLKGEIMGSDQIDKLRKEIMQDFNSFNIKSLILNCTMPLEWSSMKDHPVHSIGYYFFSSMNEGFKFEKEKINNADELTLWKLYGLVQHFWQVNYEVWYNDYAKENMKFKMRNCMTVKESHVGKNLLEVYEEQLGVIRQKEEVVRVAFSNKEVNNG